MAGIDPKVEAVMDLLRNQADPLPENEKLASILATLTATLVAFVLAAGLSEEKLLSAISTAYRISKKRHEARMH